MAGPPTYRDERELVAVACRVLAARGLADGILGHISLRVSGEAMLVRCRGPRERGLAFTTPDDIRRTVGRRPPASWTTTRCPTNSRCTRRCCGPAPT
jgi:hypothetical protein